MGLAERLPLWIQIVISLPGVAFVIWAFMIKPDFRRYSAVERRMLGVGLLYMAAVWALFRKW